MVKIGWWLVDGVVGVVRVDKRVYCCLCAMMLCPQFAVLKLPFDFRYTFRFGSVWFSVGPWWLPLFGVVKKHLCAIIKSNATPTHSHTHMLLIVVHEVIAFDYCRGLSYNCVSHFGYLLPFHVRESVNTNGCLFVG